MSESPEKKRSRYDRASMISSKDRGLQFYTKVLGLEGLDLSNKTILDLGAGKETQFAHDVTAMNNGALVISFSPHFEHADIRAHIQDKHAVAGIAQQLPLKDDSVDYIFAVLSVPTYNLSQHVDTGKSAFDASGHFVPELASELRAIFSESTRVMKAHGEARFYPIHNPDIVDILRSVVDKEREKGRLFTIDINQENFRLIVRRSS